jgi:hypothetical protein
MQLDKKLYDDINEYCKLNSLKTRDFIHKLLKEAFLKEKYGDSPFAFNKKNETAPTEQVVEEETVNIKDNIASTINAVAEISKKVQETVNTPLIPVQVLGTDITQVISEPQNMFENSEKVKPKKKRTLK